MKIQCTGLVSANGTKLLTGINSKYLIELRPGDLIEANSISIRVQAIFNDNLIVASELVPVFNNTKLYITHANPSYLLPMPDLPYSDKFILVGQQMYDGAVAGQATLLGGQVFTDYRDRSRNQLSSSKAIYLPEGFDYTVPIMGMSVVNTTLDSSTLTVQKSDVRITTAAGQNTISFITGNFSFLQPGLNIRIDGLKYQIIRIEPTTSGTDYENAKRIYLDKPVPKSYTNVILDYESDLESLFPTGCYVLVNGRLFQVAKSISSTLQLKYPMNVGTTVNICRPLMATQYSANTTEFFNIPFSTSFLENGNLLILQDLHSEDDLHSTNSCYTEVKYINRMLDTNRVVTSELNRRPYTGYVCFGVPNHGTYAVAPYTYIWAEHFDVPTYRWPYDLNFDDPILINTSVHYVNDIRGAYDNSGYFAPTFATPGFYSVRKAIPRDIWPTYTTVVNNLSLKLAAWIVEHGTKRIASINTLMQEFLKTWSYAYLGTAQKHRLFTCYEPDYYAVTEYAASREPYSLDVAVVEATSTKEYTLSNLLIRRAGLPLTSPKG